MRKHFLQVCLVAGAVLGVAVPAAVPALAAVSVDDPIRSKQWGLTTLGAETAWSMSQGKGVTVAVVDTGVDATQGDLKGRVLPGWNVLTDTPTGDEDGAGHGTEVAGIIAATANNDRGIAGLAPQSTILPVRVTDGYGNTNNVLLAEGITWAADHGADVINVSMGTTYHAPGIDAAVAHALAKNVLVVASAGNQRLSGSPPQYPAASPGAMAVGSTAADDTAAPFSTSGSFVDVAAPGVNIWTTVPGAYVPDTGTSFSAPFVAAEAALLIAVQKSPSVATIRQQIESTAKDVDAVGKDSRTGYGRIVPVDALTLATGGRLTSAATVAAPSSATVAGRTITVSGRLTTSRGAVLAQRSVSIATTVAGSTTHRTAVTTSTGRYSVTFTAVARTAVSASYAGDSTTDATRSKAVVAKVAASLVLHRTHRAVAVKVARGVPVHVQRKVHGHWRTRTSWRSSGATHTAHLAAGTYRVVTGATSQLTARTSGTWKVS